MESKINRAIAEAAARINAFSSECGAVAYPDRGLPDRSKVIEITERLRGVMFPGYFEAPSARNNVYASGYKLTKICEDLRLQLRRAFGADDEASQQTAEEALCGFVEALPEVQKLLATDAQALFDGDPAANSVTDVIFSYPGLFAITVYRLAHVLCLLKVPLIPRMMTEYAHSQTGIDINAGARIGSYFFIDHGTGVVIGETSIIGNHVTLYQGVTLGAKKFAKNEQGVLLNTPRHPIIEDNVTIYSNSSILGRITIGHDTIVGGNIWVTQSVRPYSKIVQQRAVEEMFADGAGI
jgi:serine O-acetyltransferase